MALAQALNQLAERPQERLTRETLRAVAREIMDGGAPEAQIAALLMAFRMLGEGGDEIGAFVEVMLENAVKFPRTPATDGEPLLDTCGTGGDGLHTFNVSTAAALLLAAAGVRVAKHGNRSASSKCGSADVLEACGMKLDATPEAAARQLDETKFCFLFAQAYHPAMKHAGPARRAMKIRTIFNLCGPLANPARPTHQIVGVPRRELLRPVAEALADLGRRGALVVHGLDGMDEISLVEPTVGIHLDEHGELHSWRISPHDIGVQPVRMEALVGGDAACNAGILMDVLGGQASPHADAACLNAGAALWITGRAESIRDGFEQIRTVQQGGTAAELLKRLVQA